jgi:tetratricopeptide (TPR) repeat protein
MFLFGNHSVSVAELAMSADVPNPSAAAKIVNKFIAEIARVKTPLQLAAFAVTAAVIILLFVAGRANVPSILSTGSTAVCIIVFAQLVPLCAQISDENLKVKLIIWLFVLFLLAFIILIFFTVRSIGIDTTSLENRTRSYLASGDCADGYAAASDLQREVPNWAEAYSYKGWAEFCLERYEDAAKSFKVAVNLDKGAGAQQSERYSFNLAAALMKVDAIEFRSSRTITHAQEAIEILKKVELHYTEQGVEDLDTLVNLGLVYLMNTDCENARAYAGKVKSKRDDPDVPLAIESVCAVVQGKIALDAAKQNAGSLRWIFSEDAPPERKYDYLIPAQIGYLRFRARSSGYPTVRFAQKCCKGPE